MRIRSSSVDDSKAMSIDDRSDDDIWEHGTEPGTTSVPFLADGGWSVVSADDASDENGEGTPELHQDVLNSSEFISTNDETKTRRTVTIQQDQEVSNATNLISDQSVKIQQAQEITNDIYEPIHDNEIKEYHENFQRKEEDDEILSTVSSLPVSGVEITLDRYPQGRLDFMPNKNFRNNDHDHHDFTNQNEHVLHHRELDAGSALSLPRTDSVPTDIRSLGLSVDNHGCCRFRHNIDSSISTAKSSKSATTQRNTFSVAHLLLACVSTFALTATSFILWEQRTWKVAVEKLEEALQDKEDELYHKEVVLQLKDEQLADAEAARKAAEEAKECLEGDSTTTPRFFSFLEEDQQSSFQLDTCWVQAQASFSLGSCGNDAAKSVWDTADIVWEWGKSWWDYSTGNASTDPPMDTAGFTIPSIRNFANSLGQTISGASSPNELADNWLAIFKEEKEDPQT